MGMNEGTGKGSEKRSDERPFHRYLSSFLGYSRLISVLSLRSHPPRVLRSPFARRVAPRGERDTVGGWGVRHDVSRSLALPSSVPSAGNRAHLGSLATLATPSAPLREVRKERRMNE